MEWSLVVYGTEFGGTEFGGTEILTQTSKAKKTQINQHE